MRAAEALLADRRRDVFFESDRAAWADLRDAVGRLAALVAEHGPDESGLEIGCAPTGGPPPPIAGHRRGITASGQARAAVMDPDSVPAGRHTPGQEEAA